MKKQILAIIALVISSGLSAYDAPRAFNQNGNSVDMAPKGSKKMSELQAQVGDIICIQGDKASSDFSAYASKGTVSPAHEASLKNSAICYELTSPGEVVFEATYTSAHNLVRPHNHPIEYYTVRVLVSGARGYNQFIGKERDLAMRDYMRRR